ncbi:replication terminator protein [Ligilactobacillus agilis]|uniref:replication terminator protein n=1 Tax=Ligilactobacillus agilis TaxID=1601 RepID=UPI0018689141|nr:replication terminator protein [Ligilactobacillus agilis]
MKKLIDLNLSQIADGELQKLVDVEAKKLFANILDFNTVVTAKRKLTINLIFSPDEDDREDIKLNFDVVSKLAPLAGRATKIKAERDLDTGQVTAAEIKSGVKGQTFIDENGELRTDTGERVADVEKEENKKILDLKKAKRV